MNDVSELYKKSTLVTPTEVQTYVSALENNKTIICNNNHNYIFATKLFSTSEIYTILDKKNVEEKTKKKELPVCLCNGFYDSMTLLELQPNEETLYHILTTKFWPGLLHICVRAKSFVDSLVTYNDTHIILGSPSHRHIRKILETVRMPLATFLTSKQGNLPIVTSTELQHTYAEEHIPIMDTSDTHSFLDGIQPTLIMVDNTTITLLRRGPLSFETIQEHITSTYKEPIQYKTDISIYTHIRNLKPIYTLQLMDIQATSIQSGIVSELQEKTKYMIQNIIVIDFHQRLADYKEQFYGYVDISEKGSIGEYIQNLYSVLHSVMKTECTKIYLTDIRLHTTDEYQYIQDIIDELTQNYRMVIPRIFLE